MEKHKENKNRAGSKNIILLGVVSLLNDLSSEIILPILPMFITALGGAGVVVGFVGGLRESIASILQVVCGYWSDKTGKRKPFVVSGYVTSTVFKILLAFSAVWQHVLIYGSLERIGKGLRTAARDTIVAESMPHEKGKGFGLHRAFDTLGAIMGSVTVFILFWFFGFGFKVIIGIAAVLALLSLIPLWFVKEKLRVPKKIALKIRFAHIPRKLRFFILISGTFALANFSYMFFILRAQGFFTGKLAIGIPILLYVVFNMCYAALAIPFGVLSDRIGRKNTLVIGYLLFSITCIGFAFVDSPAPFFILFALYGIVYALIDGNQRAFVSDICFRGRRATGLGAYHMVTGLAALPASIIAGILWQAGPSWPFIYGGAVGFIPILLFLTLGKQFQR